MKIEDAAEKPVKAYSLGMKQRLGIARAILHKPRLLILDEPTNGLDPAGMKDIRDLLRNLCDTQGMTVMVSSHILSEIESMADTVGIIHHGKMQKEIRVENIRDHAPAHIELSVAEPEKAMQLLKDRLGLTDLRMEKQNHIGVYDRTASIGAIAEALSESGMEIVSIGQANETLEDYFLELTEEVEQDA